jgi:hypothetical protein
MRKVWEESDRLGDDGVKRQAAGRCESGNVECLEKLETKRLKDKELKR